MYVGRVEGRSNGLDAAGPNDASRCVGWRGAAEQREEVVDKNIMPEDTCAEHLTKKRLRRLLYSQ